MPLSGYKRPSGLSPIPTAAQASVRKYVPARSRVTSLGFGWTAEKVFRDEPTTPSRYRPYAIRLFYQDFQRNFQTGVGVRRSVRELPDKIALGAASVHILYNRSTAVICSRAQSSREYPTMSSRTSPSGGVPTKQSAGEAARITSDSTPTPRHASSSAGFPTSMRSPPDRPDKTEVAVSAIRPPANPAFLWAVSAVEGAGARRESLFSPPKLTVGTFHDPRFARVDL